MRPRRRGLTSETPATRFRRASVVRSRLIHFDTALRRALEAVEVEPKATLYERLIDAAQTAFDARDSSRDDNERAKTAAQAVASFLRSRFEADPSFGVSAGLTDSADVVALYHTARALAVGDAAFGEAPIIDSEALARRLETDAHAVLKRSEPDARLTELDRAFLRFLAERAIEDHGPPTSFPEPTLSEAQRRTLRARAEALLDEARRRGQDPSTDPALRDDALEKLESTYRDIVNLSDDDRLTRLQRAEVLSALSEALGAVINDEGDLGRPEPEEEREPIAEERTDSRAPASSIQPELLATLLEMLEAADRNLRLQGFADPAVRREALGAMLATKLKEHTGLGLSELASAQRRRLEARLEHLVGSTSGATAPTVLVPLNPNPITTGPAVPVWLVRPSRHRLFEWLRPERPNVPALAP